jgi:type IV pilus assembly protein PilE
MTHQRRQSGFTLIELMIAIAIIGILAAIAIPNYQEHLRRAARAAGQSYLSDLAQRQELRFQDARVYSDQAGDFITAARPMPAEVAVRYNTPVFAKTDPAAGTLGFFSITMSPLGGLLTGDGDLYIDSTGKRVRTVNSVEKRWD